MMRKWTAWAVLGLVASGLGVSTAGAAEKAAAKTVAKLPTFAQGKWKGVFAVYTHANFDATIDENAVLVIRPKENGKPIGNPFTCYQLSCYYVPPQGHEHYRMPVAYNDPGAPMEQPKKIHLKGMLLDDVPFEVEYEFSGNRITAAGGCADPKGIEYPTTFRILSHMRPSHTIQPQVEQPEREKMLLGCVVTTRERVGGRKKRFEYPYHDIMHFSGPLEFVEIKGPYGERQIEMKAFNEEGTLRGYIYSDFCPWQGYSIYYTTQSKEINLNQNRVVMLIK